MMTDGTTEARRGGQFLDFEGLTELALRSSSLLTLEGMVRAIMEGAQEFEGGAFRDDVCLLLARRR